MDKISPVYSCISSCNNTAAFEINLVLKVERRKLTSLFFDLSFLIDGYLAAQYRSSITRRLKPKYSELACKKYYYLNVAQKSRTLTLYNIYIRGNHYTTKDPLYFGAP